MWEGFLICDFPILIVSVPTFTRAPRIKCKFIPKVLYDDDFGNVHDFALSICPHKLPNVAV